MHKFHIRYIFNFIGAFSVIGSNNLQTNLGTAPVASLGVVLLSAIFNWL